MQGIGIILLYVVMKTLMFSASFFEDEEEKKPMTEAEQKKKEKQHQALVNAVAVGDSILTTSGFYGVVIDMTDEVVIVEFGSNKNCRIPMQKAAIAQIEKPNAD